MEDPIRFDIWAMVERGHTANAVSWLTASRPELTTLEVRKLVNNSTMRGEWALIAQSILWSEVIILRGAPPTWCRSVRTYQEGYGPADGGADFCTRHQLYYGGCLGCHVCSGFYEGHVDTRWHSTIMSRVKSWLLRPHRR